MADSISLLNAKLPPGAFQPMATRWYHSRCEQVKVDFEWTIHQFELRDGEQSITFSEIKNVGASKSAWKLELDNKGLSIAHCLLPDDFGRYVHRFQEKCTQSFRVKSAFINGRREKVFLREFIVRPGMPMPIIINYVGREQLFLKSNNLIVNGNLAIYCDVETYSNEQLLCGWTMNSFAEGEQLRYKDELINDLEELFENKKMSDVNFNVHYRECQREFRAHKAILAVRSPVFAAMFNHPTQENLTGTVDVPDIEPEVFKEMLLYIYTGKISAERMDEIAAGLLTAADKYLLEKLKHACGNHLLKRLSPENCIKLLSLDENDPAYYLKGKAVDFIRRFPIEVMPSDSSKASKENAETAISWIGMWVESIRKMLFG